MSFGEGMKYKTEKEFRQVVFETLGVELGELIPNPGKRGISKLCLNNLWGHLRLKLNKPQTKYVTTAKEFYEVLLDKKVENLSLMFLIGEMCQMTFNLKNDFVESIATNNIGVAAFYDKSCKIDVVRSS